MLTLIFPIETIARELDARLVLASIYGQKHHRILLAHTPHANRLAAKLSGGGLYVGKHIFASGGDVPVAYYRAKENGFTVVHLAEEGAVFMGGPQDWSFDLDWQLVPSLLSKDDYVATWGDWQRKYYVEKGAPCPKNVRTTGHPRFDIYKTGLKEIYRQETDGLKSRFGEFILFNSNFGWAVNPLGVEDTFSRWQGYYPEDEVARLRFVQRWARQNSVYPQFVELIHRLAIQFPKINIIVRPHPSEDIFQMQAIFSGASNIHVIREGGVVPWILASSVMLNDGCTTAIEAFMMRKQVVNFTPVKDEHEAFLPNLLGIRARNQQEAIEAIHEAMNTHFLEKELPKMAHQVFTNFSQDSMGMFLALLEEAENNTSRTNVGLTPDLLFEETKMMFVNHAKQLARRLLFKKRYRSSQVMRVLFPGFDRNYIRTRLDSITKITDRPVRMRYYSPWLIELSPASQEPARWLL